MMAAVGYSNGYARASAAIIIPASKSSINRLSQRVDMTKGYRVNPQDVYTGANGQIIRHILSNSIQVAVV